MGKIPVPVPEEVKASANRTLRGKEHGPLNWILIRDPRTGPRYTTWCFVRTPHGHLEFWSHHFNPDGTTYISKPY